MRAFVSRPVILGLLAAALAAPAAAQERTPAQRQQVVDLAFVLGRSHGLRQVCVGAADQYWRGRMMRLEQVEQADAAFAARLREAFNTGFGAARTEHAACTPAARMDIRRTADKGQALSIPLSQIVQAAPAPVPATAE